MSTIVALSTTPGRSAIGVIRLSGSESYDIARRLVDGEIPEVGKVSLRSIRDPKTGEYIDNALFTFFAAPHSYTGEDVIEISCHGSPVVLRQVIDSTLLLGAVAAEPGEFTLRAVANGKLSLNQAEAVRDLINARTQGAAKQAGRQLQGELSQKLKPMKDALLEAIVLLESSVEFAEEDLPSVQMQDVKRDLGTIALNLSELASTYETGHLLRDGIRVVIVGRPNVGKSSLFNSLVGLDRAIVTDIAGTTRDCLSEQLEIQGVPVVLSDTAGLRDATDRIESIGMDRTRQAITDADVVIVVVDGSEELSEQDEDIVNKTLGSSRLVVFNKKDLPSFSVKRLTTPEGSHLQVSARKGDGLADLRAAIISRIGYSGDGEQGLLITNARHHDLLRRSAHEVESAADSIEQVSEELTLSSLHNALRLLDEITGETTSEDILTRIFSTFCIGK